MSDPIVLNSIEMHIMAKREVDIVGWKWGQTFKYLFLVFKAEAGSVNSS